MTASKVAQRKLNHPEFYCIAPRCLWNTRTSECPRHALVLSAYGILRNAAVQCVYNGPAWKVLIHAAQHLGYGVSLESVGL